MSQNHIQTYKYDSLAAVYNTIMMTKKTPVQHSELWLSTDGDSNSMKYPFQ